MKHIDVENLPEPLARAIERMVDTLRDSLSASQPRLATGLPRLPLRRGTVLSPLNRSVLYDDR